jgi:hypothetical protein
MDKLKILTEHYPDEELLSADGFEDCIIGVAYDIFTGVHRLVYSRSKCIIYLMARDKMTWNEASEFFDFNVEGAYVGKKSPIWVDDTYYN